MCDAQTVSALRHGSTSEDSPGLAIRVELSLDTLSGRTPRHASATSGNTNAWCPPDEPIDSVLYKARSRRKLSQDALAIELADASGNPAVTSSYVARWEQGHRIPGPYWREWLGIVLGIPNDRLVDAARLARARRRRLFDPSTRTRSPRRSAVPTSTGRSSGTARPGASFWDDGRSQTAKLDESTAR